jgi:hypothetical protein
MLRWGDVMACGGRNMERLVAGLARPAAQHSNTSGESAVRRPNKSRFFGIFCAKKRPLTRFMFEIGILTATQIAEFLVRDDSDGVDE